MRRTWSTFLLLSGAWAAGAPYVADAAGLRLGVSARLEVIDHVVPGVAVAVAALIAAGRPMRGGLRWSLAAGLATLAGLWTTATHVPLVPEAIEGISPWGAALVHLSAGPPVLVTGIAMLALPLASRR